MRSFPVLFLGLQSLVEVQRRRRHFFAADKDKDKDTKDELWPGWEASLSPSAELLYYPFLEDQLSVLVGQLGATQAEVPRDLAYACNDEKESRMGSRVFEVEGLFRRVRMSYFDGGDSLQVFNSLWYPSFDRVDAPLLGIDLLSFGKSKLLCVVDAQPAAGRDDTRHNYGVPHDAADLSTIRDRYDSLQGTPSGRWYEDNRYFSPQMLYGTFPDDRARIRTDLYPAFKAYLRAYVDVVRNCHVDPAYPGRRHHAAYDDFNAQRDPASKLFKSYFGEHFAEHFVHDFLFALSDDQKGDDDDDHHRGDASSSSSSSSLKKKDSPPAAVQDDTRRPPVSASSSGSEAPHHQQVKWGKEMSRADDVRRVLALAERHGTRFTARNLATAVHRVGKLGGRRWPREDRRMLESLRDACLSKLHVFEARGVANAAWGFARAGLGDDVALFDAIAWEAERRIDDMNPQEVANVAWALGTTTATTSTSSSTSSSSNKGGYYASFFRALALKLPRLLARFETRHVASVAWAFATCGFHRPFVFDSIASECLRRGVGSLSARQVSQTAWAFATADVDAPELFDALGRDAATRIGDFDAQQLANLAWAFATAGVLGDLRLFDAIARAAPKTLPCDARSLATLAYAFAVVKARHSRTTSSSVLFPFVEEVLFPFVASEAARLVRTFDPQNIGNTAWAFATAGLVAPRLFEAMAAEAARKDLDDFHPRALAATVAALADSGVRAPTLFQKVAERDSPFATFDAQTVAHTAWAFACAGWEQSKFFTDAAGAVAAKAKKAHDDHDDDDANNNNNNNAPPDLSELYLVALYVRAKWPDVAVFARDLPTLRAAYRERQALISKKQPSTFHRDVSAALDDLAFDHRLHYETPEGITLALADPKSKRAIEVNGPAHYLRDISSGAYVPDGATRLKATLLRALGWRVEHVAFFEWDAKSQKDQKLLLSDKLATLAS